MAFARCRRFIMVIKAARSCILHGSAVLLAASALACNSCRPVAASGVSYGCQCGQRQCAGPLDIPATDLGIIALRMMSTDEAADSGLTGQRCRQRRLHQALRHQRAGHGVSQRAMADRSPARPGRQPSPRNAGPGRHPAVDACSVWRNHAPDHDADWAEQSRSVAAGDG